MVLGWKDPWGVQSGKGWPVWDAFQGVNYQKVTMETHSNRGAEPVLAGYRDRKLWEGRTTFCLSVPSEIWALF